ncbi:RNA polymerase II holoenzyme cyclin-like subunit [Dimargaris xerosporica]|nr:RNA polymerase II holoenzyme cyclin-like subunit [Dimargaris xerosporica]
MSASYWDSSQRNRWTLTRAQLLDKRQTDIRLASALEVTQLHIYFANFIHSIGKKLRLRQEIVASAIVFFKRFYTTNGFYHTDPFLTAATCLYLACKVEELPHHLKVIFTESQAVAMAAKVPFTYEYSDIAEFECYLMEELDFYVIVHQPYPTLSRVFEDLELERSCLQTAWFLVNDSYRTDVALLYPPHMLALAALYITCVLNQASMTRDMKSWFAKLNIDMVMLLDIVQDILTMYEIWSSFDDRKVLQSLDKLHKAAKEASLL